MTSGVKRYGVMGYAALPAFYRSWNGTDGKYTVEADGTRKIRYNNYTCVYRYKGLSTPSVPHGNFINVCMDPDYGSIWTSNDEIALQGKVVGKVRGHDFNLAVFTGESKELLELAKTNLLRLGYMYLALKQGNWKSLAKSLGHKNGRSRAARAFKRKFRRLARSKNLAELWLELQYAWLPLLGDVHEAAKAYETLTKKPRVEQVTAQRSKGGQFNASASPANFTGTGAYTYKKRISLDLEERLSTSRSLGLLNPFSVAWELLPASFVVDWFVPIGSYIELLGVIPSLRCKSYTSTLAIFSCEGAGLSADYAGATSSYSSIITTRSAGIGLPMPAFPGFKPLKQALSTLHFANAVALVRGMFR